MSESKLLPKLSKTLDSQKTPTIIVNNEGKIVYTNSATEKIFRLSKKELKGLLFGIPVMPGETMEINMVVGGKPLGKTKVSCLRLELNKKLNYLIAYTSKKKELLEINNIVNS